MPFVVTNRHLTTNLHNFDIKCQSNSESYDLAVFFLDQPYGRGKIFFYIRREVFPIRIRALGLSGWNPSCGRFRTDIVDIACMASVANIANIKYMAHVIKFEEMVNIAIIVQIKGHICGQNFNFRRYC